MRRRRTGHGPAAEVDERRAEAAWHAAGEAAISSFSSARLPRPPPTPPARPSPSAPLSSLAAAGMADAGDDALNAREEDRIKFITIHQPAAAVLCIVFKLKYLHNSCINFNSVKYSRRLDSTCHIVLGCCSLFFFNGLGKLVMVRLTSSCIVSNFPLSFPGCNPFKFHFPFMLQLCPSHRLQE